jgi:hypothetical protein
MRVRSSTAPGSGPTHGTARNGSLLAPVAKNMELVPGNKAKLAFNLKLCVFGRERTVTS